MQSFSEKEAPNTQYIVRMKIKPFLFYFCFSSFKYLQFFSVHHSDFNKKLKP